MKAKLLSLWMLLSISITSWAQFHCGTTSNGNAPNASPFIYEKVGYDVESNHTCTKGTTGPIPIDPLDPSGRLIENSTINNSFSIPSKWIHSANQILTLKVVLYVLTDIQISPGVPQTNDNFLPNNTNHTQFLTDLVNIDFNNLFQYNTQTVRDFGNFTPDTKIRFQLETIKYHQVCNPTDLYCISCPNIPNLENDKLNIFLCGKRFNNNGYELFGKAGGNRISLSNLFDKYLNDSSPNKSITRMLAAKVLGHEFGHCVGLNHTYDNGQSQVDGSFMFTDMDFLTDVFGPLNPQTNTPIFPYPHAYSWDCVVYNTTTQTGNTACSDNIMSGHKDAGNFSFIQIGRMLRLLNTRYYNWTDNYRTNNQPIVVFSNNPNINNNNYEEWMYHGQIYRDIIVPSGTTLVMRGRFEFDEHKKIIVKKNGKLIIENAYLTSIHSTIQWGGIQVEGDTENGNFFSSPTNLGVLEISNSHIENADNAISNWITGDWNSIGGLIKAEKVVFYNNRRSVEFMKMKNINFSRFEKCIFKTQGYLVTSNPFFGHVTIWGNRHVYFGECKFMNCDVSDDFSISRDKGIFSYDANYFVDRCEFQNFSTGIHALDPAGAPFIKDGNFLNNGIGLLAESVGPVVVSDTRFVIGKKTNGLGVYLNSGIHLDDTKTYYLQENNVSHTDPNLDTKGFYIERGGSNSNQVYRNTFNGVKTGLHYFRENRDPFTVWNGASFGCNNFISSSAKDLLVNSDLNRSQDGIRSYQSGDANFSAAGNRFTASNSPGLQLQIDNQTINPILYYHFGTSSNEQPTLHTANTVVPVLTSLANTCPAKLVWYSNIYSPGVYYRSALKRQLDSLNTERKNLELAHRLLIDGGNSQQIQTEIGNAIPEESWNLRSYLLSFSPNLSEEVLRDAASSEILPAVFLLEVCLANPDATRNEEFLEFLQQSIPNPISANMAGLIRATWDDATPRTLLERNLAQKRDMEHGVFTQYLQLLQSDSSNNFHEIKEILRQKGDPNDYFTLAQHFTSFALFDSAIAVLESIPSKWIEAEHSDYLKERNAFLTYINIMKSISVEGEHLPDLRVEKQEELRQVANSGNGTMASKLARNVLCYFYQECESVEAQGRIANQQPQKIPVKSPYKIEAFPNPCTDFISINLGKQVHSKVGYRIFDAAGKLTLSGTVPTSGFLSINTKTLVNGVYAIQLDTPVAPTTLKFIKR